MIGRTPFTNKEYNQEKMIEDILTQDVKFNDRIQISTQAKDIILQVISLIDLKKFTFPLVVKERSKREIRSK